MLRSMCDSVFSRHVRQLCEPFWCSLSVCLCHHTSSTLFSQRSCRFQIAFASDHINVKPNNIHICILMLLLGGATPRPLSFHSPWRAVCCVNGTSCAYIICNECASMPATYAQTCTHYFTAHAQIHNSCAHNFLSLSIISAVVAAMPPERQRRHRPRPSTRWAFCLVLLLWCMLTRDQQQDASRLRNTSPAAATTSAAAAAAVEAAAHSRKQRKRDTIY